MTTPHQLVFSFPDVVAYGVENFIPFPGNETALKAILSADTWSHYGLIITGAPHTGKTHLAWVFQKKMGAAFIYETHLKDLEAGDDWVGTGRAYILDGAEALILAHQKAIFHLLNLVAAKRSRLLITLCQGVPPHILPDVYSRLKALPQIELVLTEEGLRIILAKRLADHQIHVPSMLIDFILTRFSRNVDDALHLLAQLNEESLRQKKPISRAMLRAFLD